MFDGIQGLYATRAYHRAEALRAQPERDNNVYDGPLDEVYRTLDGVGAAFKRFLGPRRSERQVCPEGQCTQTLQRDLGATVG